jgi:hypothetical protein
LARRSVVATLLALSSLAAPPGFAQQAAPGLGGLLLRFFSPSNPVILQSGAGGTGVGSGGGGGQGTGPAANHAAHFTSQQSAREVLTEFDRAIATQIATFPVGSSSASFTYTLDRSLGVYNRNTQSFGPLFTERPLTAGKGKLSFGMNYLDATYDSFEGHDLKGGHDLTLYLLHEDTNRDGSLLTTFFEGDIIRADLTIDLRNQTTVFFANYGIAPRLDLGVALPYLRLSMNARIDASIERLATVNDPNVHSFAGDADSQSFDESGAADGIGDVLVRTKYNFLRGRALDMAALLDLRLPTGKDEDLLGSGNFRTRLALVAGGSGRFAPRASLGYTLSAGSGTYTGTLPDELDWSAGFDLAPHRRVTITADLIGRTLFDTDRLVDHERTFAYERQRSTVVETTTRVETVTEKGNLTLFLGSAGVKINVIGRLLLVGNVLFSIGDRGLQDHLTPVVGVDYSF